MSPHDPQSSHAQLAAALETVSRLEQQLREAQKMQALGLLAGGIAHDFNNLLTVMNGYSGMLLSTGDLPEAARKSIAIIRDAGDRAGALVRQLLVFSRRIPQEPHIVDLNESVSELGRLVSRLLPASIQFTTVLEPNLSMVLADPGCIQQALLNLVLNSRDAMPEGGKLVIETANLEMDEDYRASHPGVPPPAGSGPYPFRTVRDTGIGMDGAVRKHVFEPFFTTKKSGAGTGLGLSTVHGIVTQAGGWVWVDSKPGGGATFKMLLPRSQGAPRAERVVRPAPAGLRGSETVLVVEDQEAVRRLARTALESYGYAVLEAANGQDALLMIERHTGRIDLLLSDVVMPGMTGPELAVRLRTSWPEIKVLCMSGYTAEAPSVWGMEGSSVAFIPKPFTPDALATKVREVLAGAWPAASILVVDDEDSIRSLFTLTLTELATRSWMPRMAE